MGLDNVDAKNIVPAATQTVSGGFTIQHNNKPAVLLTLSGPPVSRQTSDGTTAIADGVKKGQSLVIIVVEDGPAIAITIQHNANTLLHGNWATENGGSELAYLHVIWDGTYWVEIGRGFVNTLSGAASGGTGYSNTVSGQAAFSNGWFNTVSGNYAAVFGSNNTGSGSDTLAMGNRAVADQSRQLAHANGQFSSAGDAQFSRFICRREVFHINPTPYTIGLDGTATGPVLPAEGVWTFQVQVVGAKQDCGKVFSWLVNGCIERIGSTLTLHNSNVTLIHRDDATYDCQVAADTLNQALAVQVESDPASMETVRWVATIELTQLIYT